MKRIIEILKERISGLFLLLLAGSIIAGFSLNLSYADSQKNRVGIEENSKVLSENQQVEGIENENFEDTNRETEDDSNIPQEKVDEADEAGDEKVTEENESSSGQTRCDELKRLLKKYCGKNYSVKKCRDYLIETKDLSRKDKQCKSLYKKYHFEPKKDNRSNDDSTSASTESTVTTSLVIKAGGNSKSYSVASSPNASVIDLMGLAGVTYNRTGTICAGCMNNINGMGENSGTMSWMLYICKSGACKLAPVGDSDCKINDCKYVKDWDKAEWRYMFLDWSDPTFWDSWM